MVKTAGISQKNQQQAKCLTGDVKIASQAKIDADIDLEIKRKHMTWRNLKLTGSRARTKLRLIDSLAWPDLSCLKIMSVIVHWHTLIL